MRYFKHTIVVAFFSFVAQFVHAQTITLTQPNGGEVLYACQQYPVKWTQTGSPSNYWNIDYSLDGGTIWASVATNYLSTTGQFLWTVPTIQSSTVLLRVYDAQNSTTTDKSDAYFTINIPVTLTSPNGGESWQGATVHNITWNAVGTSNTYNIAYSLNGGTSWTNIVTNYSTTSGVYAWTVPSVALNANCLVRVQDYLQNCMQDISNTAFTITPAQPLLTSPNGNDVLSPRCTTNITWLSSRLYTTARLEYSTDNGTTWTLITSAASNTGSYTWTVPTIAGGSTQCLVKISNTGDVSVSDVSNNVFTIMSPVTILSPNGGETGVGCNVLPITISKTTCGGSWYFNYSTDNGATYTFIGSASDNGSSTQTYNWTVPNGITSSNALIYVYGLNSPSTIRDTSNAVFSIIPSNDITVTSPNGGESWVGLSTKTITWTNLPSASGQYNVQYSINGGSSWVTVASNITGNSYNWTLPNTSSTTCWVRVSDYLNTCKYDDNNAAFTITPAQPLLTSPNGNDVLSPRCTTNITWLSSRLYTTARLEYSTDNGTTWTLITNAASNTGSYTWTVPTIAGGSTQCLVKISNTGDVSVSDVSNNVFTIMSPVTILSPNGGETGVGCNVLPITFSKTTCGGTWYISYSTDNGASYTFINSVADNGSSTQTYNWTVPNGITSSNALIYVYGLNSPSTIRDTSNAVFNIIPSNDITVTSPNGGESWVGLSTKTITWTNLPSASGQYNVQYSINGGSSWVTVASNITGNSYNWTLPNTSSTTCWVRVSDYLNTCKYDDNNAAFTITPAQPLLTSPNGNDVLSPRCTTNITWLSSRLYTTARLEYSTDNGTTWTLITNAASNTGSYTWTVPTIAGGSTQCLVKISNTGDVSVSDVSNNVFTIMAPVTILSPNGGETGVGCNVLPITISKTTCGGSWYFNYSTDNGATYTFIGSASDNGSSTQTYNWTVPNGITSSNALIYVYGLNSPSTIRDTSNAVFSIIPSNDITVTSPNGGESWVGLSTKTITWTNLPSASGQYNVQYSINGGSSWVTVASNITGNSYNWTLPNTSSTTCWVRVSDYLNTCKYDDNNAAFTITPAQPLLTSPNGNDVLSPRCTTNITWLSSRLYTTARLEYSTDNGTTWTLITNAASNTGSYTWTVPTIAGGSTQCLVKISNTGDVSVSDVSNNVFTIMSPVTILSPNGGETGVGCNVLPITFSKTTCGGTWYISYSTDNGASYTFINSVADNGSSTQTYNWTVPNGITSSNALIYVYGLNSPSTIRDTSNAVFNIIPSNDITVTSPNGGESWVGLSTKTITWTNLPSASGQYNVQYSINGGSSWVTVASNITGNSYNWTLPNTSSTTCWVRVSDYLNTCKYDDNNAAFTITPAQPLLTSPNGNDVLSPRCTTNITWLSSRLYTTARLEYSTDNGTTWTLITNAASNTGSYTWTVPTIAGGSTQCLVKISNTGDVSVSDVSNNVFTIMAPVTILSPNGGETGVGCNVLPITISKTTCGGSWYFNYSTDNGATYTFIGSASDNGSSTQTYNWTVPNGITSSNALIYVYGLNSPSAIRDTSNAVFNIIPSNDITVTSPNGGESWVGLSTKTITWTNLPSASGQYNVQYSINGGSSWVTVASNITGNSYNWTLPNTSSTTCWVRVSDYLNTCKYDDNNTAFTITPAIPFLISPNGGEVLYSGTVQNITWTTSKLYTTARLEYSTDNGTTWTLITNAASNTGSYAWTIPNLSSTKCLVKISNTGDVSVSDVSNSLFTIKPAVTILTPNGGDVISVGGCTVSSITFDRSSAWTTYVIDYSLDDGNSWTNITSSFTASANPATYNWNVPNIFSDRARVRVKPTTNNYFDISDTSFSIIRAVTLIQPNFGGIMQVGSTYDISWSSDGISSLYDIFYSTNGGSTFTNIVTGYSTSNNKYTWTVPNNVSSNCRILIRDNVNSCKTDTSDLPFTISTTPAPITLVKPNGITDTVYTCTNYTISWTEPTTIGSYNIAYSTNAGSTWTNIVTSYTTTTHNYVWTVPNSISSSSVLLRVSAASNSAVYDLSDAYFTVMPLTYTFIGNGNWEVPTNWLNNQMPPSSLTASCAEIIIDPVANGECVLNNQQYMGAGTKITVKAGKKFRIVNSLNIQN